MIQFSINQQSIGMYPQQFNKTSVICLQAVNMLNWIVWNRTVW